MRKALTRDQERSIWAVALVHDEAAELEEKVCRHIEMLLGRATTSELPQHMSSEGLAQAVRLLLDDIVANERPLLAGLRTLHRHHFSGATPDAY